MELAPNSALGGQTPEDKAVWLPAPKARTGTQMLADGDND
jgi:hypothetical protein